MHDQSHNKSTVLGIAHYSPFIILFVCLCVSFVVSIRLIHLLETDTNVCCRVVEWLSVSLCIPGFIYLFDFLWIWSYSFFQFSVILIISFTVLQPRGQYARLAIAEAAVTYNLALTYEWSAGLALSSAVFTIIQGYQVYLAKISYQTPLNDRIFISIWLYFTNSKGFV